MSPEPPLNFNNGRDNPSALARPIANFVLFFIFPAFSVGWWLPQVSFFLASRR
jgi:hypothetical protein